MKGIAALNHARGLNRQPAAPPTEDAPPEPASRRPPREPATTPFLAPYLARWLGPQPAPDAEH